MTFYTVLKGGLCVVSFISCKKWSEGNLNSFRKLTKLLVLNLRYKKLTRRTIQTDFKQQPAGNHKYVCTILKFL